MSPARPPGPPGRFFTGHLADYRRERLNFFVRCARDYGDVAYFRFGPYRCYLVSDPQEIEKILVDNSRLFIKHFELRRSPLVLGKGLLTSEGDFWLRQRRLIQPAFNRTHLLSYAQVMVDATERILDTWEEGQQRDLAEEMSLLTMDVAARTLFGGGVEGEARAVERALRVLQERFLVRSTSLWRLPWWVPTPGNFRLRRAVGHLDEILYGFIRRRRAEGKEYGDLLSLLLHARDEGDQTGMTDRQLRDEAMTLFLAGQETTALALSWAWYLLAQHAEVEERLAAEVRQVLGDRPPTVEDVPRLPYTDWVVHEAMRLYPPAYIIGRECLCDYEVGGYLAPRGTTLFMSQFVVHRDGRWWSEPERFRPERWGDGSMKATPKYAYFPFGGGPRLCIGNTFALLEATLVLARIAQRWRFTLKPGAETTPGALFTLRPVGGVPAVLRKRVVSGEW
jgi:cytochrome P450